MGTNYYLETDYCPCCGKPKQNLHIGKSSAGWQFLFQKHSFIKTIDDLKNYLKRGRLKDEYGEEICLKDFWTMVDDKQTERKHKDCYVYVDGYAFLDSDFS